MSKIAFIYPGQGAQVCGMGKDFYEKTSVGKTLFDQASEWLGFSLPELCFVENEKLNQTEYTQVAMVATSIVMTKVLMEAGIYPSISAGLSLGEYCALFAVGAIGEKDAIKTVRQRGILMQKEVPFGLGGMAAVLGMEVEKIEAVIAPIEGVEIANYNCPGQIVISGKKEAVDQAGEALKEAGARRVISLNVSGPFHSTMLKGAGEKLGKVLEEIEITMPRIPYVSNVTATEVTQKEEIKPLLEKQVYSSVRWQQSVECMIVNGVDTFVEIGPGKTLAGFIKKINRSVRIFNIEKVEDIEKVAKEIVC